MPAAQIIGLDFVIFGACYGAGSIAHWGIPDGGHSAVSAAFVTVGLGIHFFGFVIEERRKQSLEQKD